MNKRQKKKWAKKQLESYLADKERELYYLEAVEPEPYGYVEQDKRQESDRGEQVA